MKSQTHTGRPVLLNVVEAARFLRVSITTVHRMIKRRELPCFKIGCRWRFNAEQLEQWTRAKTALVPDGSASAARPPAAALRS